MIKRNGFHYKKACAMLFALVLAVTVPMAAFAQTATADTAAVPAANMAQAKGGQGQRPEAGGMNRGLGGMQNSQIDTSTLTDDQKAVYEKAQTLYEQIEDAVLADLVAANVFTQADVDSYTALRTAEKSLKDLDQSAWTAQQYKAYYEAVAQTGDARKTALQALADAGQLTQAQADAMSAENQADLWSTISENANTNTAIKTALNTLQQARQTYQSTLKTAGITTAAGTGSFGMGDSHNMPGQPGNQGNTSDGMMQNAPGQDAQQQNGQASAN